jgi:hypothetical protein
MVNKDKNWRYIKTLKNPPYCNVLNNNNKDDDPKYKHIKRMRKGILTLKPQLPPTQKKSFRKRESSDPQESPVNIEKNLPIPKKEIYSAAPREQIFDSPPKYNDIYPSSDNVMSGHMGEKVFLTNLKLIIKNGCDPNKTLITICTLVDYREKMIQGRNMLKIDNT